jgi:hypothetical protein
VFATASCRKENLAKKQEVARLLHRFEEQRAKSKEQRAKGEELRAKSKDKATTVATVAFSALCP